MPISFINASICASESVRGVAALPLSEGLELASGRAEISAEREIEAKTNADAKTTSIEYARLGMRGRPAAFPLPRRTRAISLSFPLTSSWQRSSSCVPSKARIIRYCGGLFKSAAILKTRPSIRSACRRFAHVTRSEGECGRRFAQFFVDRC